MWAYFDIFVGVSGDMVLGALVDAGLPVTELERVVQALGLTDHVSLRVDRVRKGALAATKVTVITHGEPDSPHAHLRYVPPAGPLRPPYHAHSHGHSHRTLGQILDMIARAALPPEVKERATAVFRRLAQAEARVHGMSPEDVHFHEVGALDAVVDIVASVAGLHALGVERVVVSPIPLARGYVETAHGRLPVPAPATAALLEGVPVRGLDLEAETVTPTGAALMTTLADAFGPFPPMQVNRVGYGAGTMDLPVPNVLRLWLGEPSTLPEKGWEVRPLTVLSTNVDDMPGEWLGPLFDHLLTAGALDVWFTPIQMKKGRPGVLITVLAPPAKASQLRALLLRETTTLGVREYTVNRWCVPRRQVVVETRWGPVRLKVARLPDGTERAKPEFEDCRTLAEKHGIPLADICRAAMESQDQVSGE